MTKRAAFSIEDTSLPGVRRSRPGGVAGALHHGARAVAGEIAYCMVTPVAEILNDGVPLVRNASVAATELIREAILDGRLEPGKRLKEEELARELGISRTPVREALLMLQAEGLIMTVPNRGAVVRAHDAEDLQDLYQLRALLEGYAARLAALRISEEEVERLGESCDRFEALESEDVRELVKENLLFHNAILAAAGSARLTSMVRRVIELPLVYKSYIWYSPDQKRTSGYFHRQITTALAAHDPERAELIMKEHVFVARDLLVAHLRDLEGGS
jgi:DNA-binding GntR family transcriptional regulator